MPVLAITPFTLILPSSIYLSIALLDAIPSGRKANLYEVTDKFLSYLGIRDIRELPDYDLFKDKIKDMENISTDEN